MIRGILLAATAASLIGHWQGSSILFGNELDLSIDFFGPPGSVRATMSSPATGVNGDTLTDLVVRGDSISWVLPVADHPASFAGVVRGDSIVGMSHQSGLGVPFRLRRSGAGTAASSDPSAPYAQEEVRIASGAITLAGTLTHPRGPGPYPAIVLVSGSGPQNRDETLFGFKPFAILADHLSRHGIAVLRCDDRGVGGSTGKFSGATSLDFANDLRASIHFLAKRKDIDRRRIGALGHSEGGIIAPMVAARSDSVAFVILLAGPGLRGDSVLYDQADRIARSIGQADTIRKMNHIAQQRIVAAASTGQGWDEARAACDAVLRLSLGIKPGPAGDSLVADAVMSQLKPMRSPWMKTFVTHDPVPVLEKVRCPVLALFGAQDLQVAPEVNAPPIERALKRGGNRDVTVRIFPRANHLFQPTDNGNPALYDSLPKEFVPGLVDTISTWVTVRARPAAAQASAPAKR